MGSEMCIRDSFHIPKSTLRDANAPQPYTTLETCVRAPSHCEIKDRMRPPAARACSHTVNSLSIDSLVLDSSFVYFGELSDKLIARGEYHWLPGRQLLWPLVQPVVAGPQSA